MKFKLKYSHVKRFLTLTLHNDLVVCGSPNLISV